MKNSPKTILLVEDEALVGIAESQALTTEGYEVIHVLSGEDAISFFREKMGTADLILMDVDLGEGIDGTVAAQEILRDNDIPVVFLSSHTEKEILEKTEKITSYGYVVKNTGITVLTASIKMAAKLHEAHRRLKEDERIIRESEKRYRATFETTGSATVVLREDTIISFANREFERLSGYSKEEVEGKMSWTEWVVKDDLNIMMERHRKRREEGKEIPREYEFRFVKKSGEIRNILLHVDMVPGTTESIASLVDITDLRASEERYRKLAENAGESIVVAQGQMLKYANPITCKLTGFSMNEIYTKPFIEFIHPDDRARVAENYRARAEGRQALSSYEFRMLAKDGNFRWVEINVVEITWEGAPATLNFFKDFTERKLMEEQLEKSLIEKDLLMRELQHRVKNNLNVVSGLLGLEMDKLSDERGREVFRNAQSRINSMSAIYERLNRSPDFTRVDLAPYVRDLAAMLAETYSLDSDKVRIIADIQEVCLDMKRAVPLGLIINELITNAIKYAYPEGIKGDIRIDLKVRGDKIDLSVGDNGVGLPDGFNFLKSESMGLHLIWMLTNQIGGAIEFAPGPGTNVLLSFPLQPADSQSNAYHPR